jgi:diguanylate cyclase (GGDEF)-like protein
MPTAMTKSNTIEFDSIRRLLKSKDGAAEYTSDKEQLKFRLTSLLQSSLELEQVLITFHRELNTITPLTGLAYVNENSDVNFSTGKKSTHSCGYRLITQQDHLGELTLYRNKRFTEGHLQIIEESLGTLICPLRNALQYREALIASLTDPLTGSGNRLALENTLTREIELAKRHKSSLSLLLIDVDNFKLVNDQWGHKAGDKVLKMLVQKLNQVNRQTDLIYRYGGEEFVILLNETSQAGAEVIAERIRSAVEQAKIDLVGQSIQITVSLGAAALKPNDSKDRLFKRADKALYQAKNSGKNKVVIL